MCDSNGYVGELWAPWGAWAFAEEFTDTGDYLTAEIDCFNLTSNPLVEGKVDLQRRHKPWYLDGVHCVTFPATEGLLIFTGEAFGECLTGRLPQTAGDLGARLPDDWDGKLYLAINDADLATDIYLLFKRPRRIHPMFHSPDRGAPPCR